MFDIRPLCAMLVSWPWPHTVLDTWLCLQDILRLYGFALVMQFFILIPYLAKASVHNVDQQHVLWKVLDLLTYVAPPGLTTVMVIAGAVARSRLRKDGLRLLRPEVMKQGAAVDIVCFDKTGTLTHSAVRDFSTSQ